MSGLSQNFSSVYLLAMLALISLACYAKADAQYSDLPPPPTKPERFTSKQQLKEYLVKLHEYYAIIGRPRFGRRASPFKVLRDIPSSLDEIVEEKNTKSEQLLNEFMRVSAVVEMLDSNQNGLVSKDELLNFLHLFSQQK